MEPEVELKVLTQLGEKNFNLTTKIVKTWKDNSKSEAVMTSQINSPYLLYLTKYWMFI